MAASLTGTDGPAPRQWDIVQGGNTVATAITPNGWTVSVSGSSGYPGYPGAGGSTTYTFTVAAPAGAPVANYYSVRYSTVPVGQTGACVSASFDVVAPGGSTSTGDPTVQQGGSQSFGSNGTTSPAPPTWDIVQGGALVATADNPTGWSVSESSNAGINQFQVTAPAGAVVGSSYEVRYAPLYYYYGYLSAPFSVIGTGQQQKGVSTYTWDPYGNCTSETDARGTTTTYTYSYANFALGELMQVQVGSKSPITHTYYEPSGLTQSEVSPLPGTVGSNQTVTTSYTYDNLGNVLTKTEPGNNSTTSITSTYNYTSDGGYNQPAAIGKPLTITDNLGHVSHFRYDTRGNNMIKIDAIGNETDESFNIADQPLATTFPATGQTGTGHAVRANTFLYTDGPRTAVTDFDESSQQVRQVTTTYGAEGETLSVSGSTEPVSYTYDALYRKKTLADGKGNTTTYTYNTAGYLSGITYPGGDAVQYPQYDSNGNLLKRIDGNNVETDYLYNDPESELTDIQYPATPAINVHFVYDGYGRRTNMSDGTGSTGYNYGDGDESLNVLTTYTGLPTLTLGYTYYPDGSRQQMTTPAGAFTYTYDAGGRCNSLTNPYNEVSSWTYLDNDWESTATLQNGVVSSDSYNARGFLTRLQNSVNGNLLSDFGSASGIQYDAIGNRTSIPANIPASTIASGTASYTYNSQDELTQEQSARNSGYTNNFGYDAAFNPISFKGAAQTFNSNNQNTAFTYDHNGNSVNYKNQTLAFDAENRMTTYGNLLSAGYNGDNVRVWNQNGAGVRTYFLYDEDNPVCELSVSGNVTAVNTFGEQDLLSRHTSIGSAFYTFDPQGSVCQRFDLNGGLLSTSAFDDFGSKLTADPATDPWGYCAKFGYYTDVDTGLCSLTCRYYDPAQGRMLNRDPSGYDGGVNLYSYCENSVTNNADPSGLVLVDPGGRHGCPGGKTGLIGRAIKLACTLVQNNGGVLNAWGSKCQENIMNGFCNDDSNRLWCSRKCKKRDCGFNIKYSFPNGTSKCHMVMCLPTVSNPKLCGRPNLNIVQQVATTIIHEALHCYCDTPDGADGQENPTERSARLCAGSAGTYINGTGQEVP